MTRNSHQHFDFIIIGGGPAGAACAIILRRAGFQVLVCEKEFFPREKICGDCINLKNWRLFEQLSVADMLKAKKLSEIDQVRIVGSWGQDVSAQVSAEKDKPFFAMKRSILDTLLLNRAQEEGATIWQGMQAVDARWDGKWHVEARGSGLADRISFAGNFLIGADGRNSIVATKLLQDRKASPLKKHNRKLSNADRVGIQWHTAYQPQVGTAVEMYLFGSGYGGIVNVDTGSANVAMVAPSWIAPFAKKSLPEFLALTLYKNPLAADRFADLTPAGEIRFTYPIGPKSNRSRHPRAVLIGDAHKTVEPFTGEGIYYALQGGIRAGIRLAEKFGAAPMSSDKGYGRRFWVNRIYSPALKTGWAADKFISLGSRSPGLISLIFKTVFHSPGWKGQPLLPALKKRLWPIAS
jgi:flavin-dependent dehydrogenase